MARKASPDAPWQSVAKLTTAEVHAIRAIANGEAAPDQQRRFWTCLLNKFCRDGEISFLADRDGGDRGTAFVEGRRFVAGALKLILELPEDQLRTKDG